MTSSSLALPGVFFVGEKKYETFSQIFWLRDAFDSCFALVGILKALNNQKDWKDVENWQISLDFLQDIYTSG